MNPLAGTHSSAPDGTMWLTNSNNNNPFITFDLGKIHNQLDVIQVWNYNESTGVSLSRRGVQDMRILVSATGLAGSWTTLTDPTDLDQVFHLTQAPQSSTVDFSQLIELNLTYVSIRYVQFDIISNWFGSNLEDSIADTDSGFVGLSEVRFFGVVPTPAALPTGLAMLILIAARRRR